MALLTTLYVRPETTFYSSAASVADHGRAFVRVEVDGLAIQSDNWQDAQLLVDALTAQIDAAKNAENAAGIQAITGIAS